MSISAGFAGSVQAAVLGRLGDRVGTVEAVGFSTLVAGATGILVLLVARRSLQGVQHGFHQPVWMWLGGILSAFIVLSITFAAPKIGHACRNRLGDHRESGGRGRDRPVRMVRRRPDPARVDASRRNPPAGRRSGARPQTVDAVSSCQSIKEVVGGCRTADES